MTRVALDVLGGDGAPEVVADAVAVLAADDIDLVLVGPERTARDLLRDRGLDPDRFAYVDTSIGVDMAADALAVLREQPKASVLLAAQCVRDGQADAWVSVGHSGAAVSAAALVLGRIHGVTRPALAVVMPAIHRPVILLDAGASLDATPDVLLQHALAGVSYAEALEWERPTVGLLSIGTEPGKGDPLRKVTQELMATALPALHVHYGGLVEGYEAASGRHANVIVSDGFTGNVLLKGMEGAVGWSALRMGAEYGDDGPAKRVMEETAAGDFAGGMVLGVAGVSVVGHGAATATHIAACVRLAARAAAHDLVAATATSMARLQIRGLADE